MKIIKRLSLCILYFFVTISCKNSPEIEIPEDIAVMEHVAAFSGKEAPKGAVSFERVTAFGDTEEFYFGQLGAINVDERDRVYLADGREGLIHIYNGDGSYIRSVGGKGGGPGEFQSISSLEADDSFLYAMDIVQRRLTAFHLDDFSLAFTLNPGNEQDGIAGNPVDFAVLSDGN
ncbi:MAG: 6-bladed beta-propeller, partial [Balneolaceae bacterium]